MVERKMVTDCLGKGPDEGLRSPGDDTKCDFETRSVAVRSFFTKHLKQLL